MKRTMMIGVGVLALMAGSAHAAGCSYSKQAKMASAADTIEPATVEVQQSELLALLKQKEDALEKSMPVVHN